MTDRKFQISQETIAIVTSAIVLFGTAVYSIHHTDDRIDRLRDEMRAERESVDAAARADRDLFTREILRLTQQQARLSAVLDSSDG